jgi:hypothetical protein
MWCDEAKAAPIWPAIATSWFINESRTGGFETFAVAVVKDGVWRLATPGYPTWTEYETLTDAMVYVKAKWPYSYPSVEIIGKDGATHGERTCSRGNHLGSGWASFIRGDEGGANPFGDDDGTGLGTDNDPGPGRPSPGDLSEYVW